VLIHLAAMLPQSPMESGNAVPELMGISHVDLTVSDCDRSAAWWQEILVSCS
jgi:catechol-2,3-dioxygenase